jgi:acetoin utilization protein AcuB
MLVRDIMRSPVITVEAGATLAEAYETMQTRHFRHLPVVQEDRLVGIVTDRDLRFATSSLHPTPFDADARIEDVMSRAPTTAMPLDPVEEAARLMRERKIGCLPVLEDDRLVGIVTGTDLLDAVVQLTGLARPSGRLEVRLDDQPGRLVALADRVAAQGIDLLSMLSYTVDDAHSRVILRVDTLNTRTLAASLREAGFEVSRPPEKSWSP